MGISILKGEKYRQVQRSDDNLECRKIMFFMQEIGRRRSIDATAVVSKVCCSIQIVGKASAAVGIVALGKLFKSLSLSLSLSLTPKV